jgi:hypothetical protein
MSLYIGRTATTVVTTLEHIETTLMVLFEQQQHLASGNLPYVEERRLLASQLQLILQAKSAVQMARVATWSLMVPEGPEAVTPLHEIKCEQVNEEEEEGSHCQERYIRMGHVW